MNREMKIVAIVFGSLFVLLVVAGIAVIAIGSRMATTIAQTQNPAAIRHTAAKVARFTLPPGYRIASATDLGIQQTVTLVHDAARGRGGFTIQLQRSALANDAKTTAEGMTFALGLAARVVHCRPHASVDTIALADRSIDLHAISCVGGAHPLRIESGVYPDQARSLTIIATGVGDEFDRPALVLLLRSIR